jgi:hypothetical protein
MTRFQQSFSTQQHLPPWEAPGARTWAFAVRLPEEAVKKHLDERFNLGDPDHPPYLYTPLPGPQYGLLTVSHHPAVISRFHKVPGEFGSTEDGYDRVQATEVYLAVPVLRRNMTPQDPAEKPKIIWIQPFLFSDKASVVFSAREIWGAAMEMATIALEPESPTKELHADAAIIGIETFDPSSEAELLAMLHVRTGPPTQATPADIVRGNPDLEAFVELLAGSGMFAGAPADAPEQSGVQINNLKQFREIHDMGSAIYRAIVASRTLHKNIDDLTFFDAGKVEIDLMWSDSIGGIVAFFGKEKPDHPTGAPPGHECVNRPPLPPGEMRWDLYRIPLQAELAFCITSDVWFEVLETLYTYQPC